MYRGVPTMDFMTASSLLRLLANPKSLSLQVDWWRRILAGLRSLWMMPLLCRYLAPFMMSLRQFLASLSGILFFLCSSLRRSPSWQSSVTMYMLLVVWQMSKSWTMFWWDTFFMMSISDWMFLTLQALENIFLSMTLTATGCPVSISLPRYTVAQDPCPSCFFRLNWYFSIFFSPSICPQRIQDIINSIEIGPAFIPSNAPIAALLYYYARREAGKMLEVQFQQGIDNQNRGSASIFSVQDCRTRRAVSFSRPWHSISSSRRQSCVLSLCSGRLQFFYSK